VNQFGAGTLSADTAPLAVSGPPSAPTALAATRGNGQAGLSWTPGNDGGSPITGYTLQVRTGTTTVSTRTITGAVSSTTVTGLTNGTAYNFRLIANNANGASPVSLQSNTVTPATTPTAPTILAPAQGAAGGTLTAIANWAAPASTGGSAITNYRVTALFMQADGVTPDPLVNPRVQITNGAARTSTFTLSPGSWRFEVQAINSVGNSPSSERSALVSPR
jgi:hypothetical protein